MITYWFFDLHRHRNEQGIECQISLSPKGYPSVAKSQAVLIDIRSLSIDGTCHIGISKVNLHFRDEALTLNHSPKQGSSYLPKSQGNKPLNDLGLHFPVPRLSPEKLSASTLQIDPYLFKHVLHVHSQVGETS